MFADDTTFVAHNYWDAQETVSRFLKSTKTFGLKINLKKTEIRYCNVIERFIENWNTKTKGKFV